MEPAEGTFHPNKVRLCVQHEDRKLAKAVNFGLLYGGGATMLQQYAKSSYGVDLTIEEARQAKQAFHDAYPAITKWQTEAPAEAKHRGYVETVGGWVRRFDANSNLFTEACNSIVQGSGADLLMLAIANVHAALQGLPARLINFVHDELVLEVREDQVTEMEELVRGGCGTLFGPCLARTICEPGQICSNRSRSNRQEPAC